MKTQEEVINDYLERHTPFGPAIRSELSGIWNNGYCHGYETAERKAKDKYEVDTNMQYNLGYQHGYDNGKDVAYKELSGWTTEEGKAKIDEAHTEGYDVGYRTGKQLAWAIAQMIVKDPAHCGFTVKQLFDMFDVDDPMVIIAENSIEEIINKIDAFHDKNKSAPTNWDKFREDFSFITGEILHTSLNGVRGFFVTDDWANRAYEEK